MIDGSGFPDPVYTDQAMKAIDMTPRVERRLVSRQNPQDKWTAAAIEARDFRAYRLAIMHDWSRTLTLMAAMLVPFFFVLDIIMMPAALLPKFALYRGVSTVLAVIQAVVVRKTKPSVWSHAHGYIVSLQVGGMIALMTTDLGGFGSSYYAGLNLVIIGVNLLMPWQAYHTVYNAFLAVAMYVALNLIKGSPYQPSILVNNLFFLGSTAVLSAAINYVRFNLIGKEFALLIDLEKTRDALIDEKELVENKSRSLKSLLDVSGQGFLSFDKNFRIGSEYSRECLDLFGQDIEGSRIDELLFADPSARSDFKKGLSLFFEGKSSPEVIFDLLDSELTIGERVARVEYKAVHESQVMAVLTDITEERRLREAARRENEKWNMLLKVIQNRSAFAVFNHEAKELFAALENRKAGYEPILYDLHTFKGNAGFLGFVATQTAAHELEDFLKDRIALGQEIRAGQETARLVGAYAEELSKVTDVLGSQWRQDAESIEVPRAEFLMIEDHIKTYCPDKPLIETMEIHRRKPLAEMFGRFPQLASDLASRMGKRLAPLVITGGNLPVVTDDFEELVESFTHIVRNMVDHGIEPPVIREAEGKPAAGRVEIDIEQASNEVVFTFMDDGQGIPLDEVAKKAKEIGLVEKDATPSVQELLGFIFRDSFSTSTKVSEISGRGVGLPAVRDAVQRMGGRIRVKTTKDHGTVFTVTVPISGAE